jgi:hypothetical protein
MNKAIIHTMIAIFEQENTLSYCPLRGMVYYQILIISNGFLIVILIRTRTLLPSRMDYEISGSSY